jgi:hypothetical protein
VTHRVDDNGSLHLNQAPTSTPIPVNQHDGCSTETSTRTIKSTHMGLYSLNIPQPAQSIREEAQVTRYESGISTVDLNHVPTTPPYPLIRPKSRSRPQRVRSHPFRTLNPEKITFSLDLGRQRLLEHILNTDWYRDDDPEPNLGTQEADNILFCMDVLHNVSFPSNHIKAGRSIYSIFTDLSRYKCLMCDSTKKSAQRAVECVRAHINHRPFRCSGWKSGCSICRPDQE